jgi:uroporphyrinogen-III synthase
VPDEHSGAALAEAFQEASPQRVLLPQAEIAGPVLRDQLRAAGFEVTELVAYRTLMGQGGVDLPALLGAGQVDAVTFTSASTVTHCLARLSAESGDPTLLAGVSLACIGPTTAAALESAGLGPPLVAEDYTLAGLVALLASAWG